MAASADHPARRFRLLPCGTDGPPDRFAIGAFGREVRLRRGCEENQVDYLFGLARNSRLVTEICAELRDAEADALATSKPARRFKDFMWTTRKSWNRRRRVIGKAEWSGGDANPRFVVTSLRKADGGGQYLYEKVYCARLKLLKIGALIALSVRRIKIAMASGYPWQQEWAEAYPRLSAAA